MQVLSCQRGVSLIEVQKPQNAVAHSSGRGPDADDALRRTALAQVRARRHAYGFTLVELMITLVVVLVLIMIAVPSFRTITLSNKLTTTANDVVGAINIARMEAIKRNASTQLCSNSASGNSSDPSSSALGGGCGTKTGAVYALNGTAPVQVLAGTVGITSPIQLNGDMTALRFTAQGLGRKVGETTPYGKTVADICTSQMSTNNHRVIMMTAGSILETKTISGDCPSS